VLTWFIRVEDDTEALKHDLPLDLHHVEFVSAGGEDSLGNLVPVCPLCHRVIHKFGVIGHDMNATHEQIKALWQLWVAIGELPLGGPLGSAPPLVSVMVDVPTYALFVG
jgi:hypothetical protein